MRTSEPIGLEGLAAGNVIVITFFKVQQFPYTGAVEWKKMEVHELRPTI
jgi:hypothetical protein